MIRKMSDKEKSNFIRFVESIMEKGTMILSVACLDSDGTFRLVHACTDQTIIAYTEACIQRIMDRGPDTKKP